MNKYIITAIILIIVSVNSFLSAASCCANTITKPPKKLAVSEFYEKYLDCGGIPVTGSAKVDDRAFWRLRYLLDSILVNRPDIKAALASSNYSCIIIAHSEQVTEIPEYSYMEPKEYWDKRARGFGGPTTSCGEENLLNLPQDRYYNESIFIHELAHSIHDPALVSIDKGFQATLDKLYQSALSRGLYENDYAATNASEYWAESVQAYFDCDAENNQVHNYVNTRAELREYDPDVAKLLDKVFGFTDGNDWRYSRYKTVEPVEYIVRNGKMEVFCKYNWCQGFDIYADETCSNESILKTAESIRDIFKYRYDILKELAESNISVGLLSGKNIERFAELSADDLEKKADKGQTGMNELILPVLTSQDDKGKKQLLEQLAMAVYYTVGIREGLAEGQALKPYQEKKEYISRDVFDDQIKKLYESALSKNIWSVEQTGINNRYDYFAAGFKAFFNAGDTPVVGRSELLERDRELGDFIYTTLNYPKNR